MMTPTTADDAASEHDQWMEARVRRRAGTNPDGLAAISPAGTLTWSQLDRGGDQFAAALERHGVQPGERVGWLGANDLTYPQVLLGAQRRRAALIGLNWRLSQAEMAACVNATTPKLVVADSASAGLLSIEVPRLVIEDQLVPPWSQLSAGSSLSGLDRDVAMLFFTSGSTGTPKAVALNRGPNEQLVAHPRPVHIGAGDRMLIVPPVFHLAGAVWAQIALHFSATQVYVHDTTPGGLVHALADHEVTHALMVPTLLQMVVNQLRVDARKLPDLRQIVYGTAPISPTLLSAALEVLSCSFAQVYGLSEAGGTVCGLRGVYHREDDPHLNSVGTPVSGATVRIVDPATGAEVPPNSPGEVVVKTPYVMQEYWDRPDLTEEVLRDGWLHTRDAGMLDKDGFLFILGRIDDMLITGGENVQPLEVEAVLFAMPGVSDCAVFGVPDPMWGDRICAAIVSSDPGLTQADVIDFCRARLAHYQAPKQVVFVNELPRNATGKVLRQELSKRYAPMPSTQIDK